MYIRLGEGWIITLNKTVGFEEPTLDLTGLPPTLLIAQGSQGLMEHTDGK